MNFLETDSYTTINKSYYNESLLYNSKLSTKYKTLFSFDETAAKEDTEKVYTLYCHCINLYFNEEN